MPQLRMGGLFADLDKRPVNGRTEGERVERYEKVSAAILQVRKLRALYRQQALAARRLEEALKRELRNLE